MNACYHTKTLNILTAKIIAIQYSKRKVLVSVVSCVTSVIFHCPALDKCSGFPLLSSCTV